MIHFDLGPLDTYMLTNPRDIERVLVSEASRFRKPQFQDQAIGDLLGDGLLMSEGETWQTQRRLAQPAFDMRRISTMAGMMTDRTESMLADWHDGDVVDIQLEMTRLTVEIIVDAMFGSDLDDERIRRLQEHLEPLGARFEPDPIRFLTPDWVPTRENREYKEALSVLEDIIWDLVEERRGTEYGPGPASSVADDSPADGPPVDSPSRLRPRRTDRQEPPRRTDDDALGGPRHYRADAHVRVVPAFAASRRGGETAPRGGRSARRSHAHLRGRAAVGVHRARPERGDAAVPAGVRDVPRTQNRRSNRWLSHPRGLGAHAPTVGCPPLGALVGRPARIRPRPLDARAGRQPTEFRVLPLRRRAASLYRQTPVATRRSSHYGNDCAAIRTRIHPRRTVLASRVADDAPAGTDWDATAGAREAVAQSRPRLPKKPVSGWKRNRRRRLAELGVVEVELRDGPLDGVDVVAS
ncbi:unspecific monooxygenase (cytochrome P450) [Haloferax elongans ATCC BAA-1513]|uniref:Unspecific monooxygenase (Cytochrome P450) n=1 Tax=Haloferax elongans ATCC BAA-1513 TaxID=1230453 RepID=M0HU04_HALEO|nr:unspecific monooxygenase (cytochrome P450) [Haloferax elongans ATCC BAA-1513]